MEPQPILAVSTEQAPSIKDEKFSHFCVDAKLLKQHVEHDYYVRNLVSIERFLRKFLSLLGIDYDTVFQPCEQELHRLRDRVFLRNYYKAN